MKRVALIVAGGRGKRMNSKIPKQFLYLNKLPILIHTAKKFSHFDEIVIVLHKAYFKDWKKICSETNFNKKIKLVEGGENRFQSVKNGLAHIENNSIVAIHDGVRPLVSKNLIDVLISKTKTSVGSIPVLPIKNSICQIKNGVTSHVDRKNLFQIQTPQCFIGRDIKDAYKQKYLQCFTDDASVLQNNGGTIISVIGEEKNIKITTREDLRIAEVFMQ